MRFIFALLLCFSLLSSASAEQEDGSIPVLLYHTWIQSGCSYENNALITLPADLETLYGRGWTVIPALWIAQIIAGERSRHTLPKKIIAITLDDGADWDWYDSTECGGLPSAYTTLKRFKEAHPDLPAYSPHATSFVIASPTARKIIDPSGRLRDDWWWQAENASGGLMSIGNHSADHDHPRIDTRIWDPYLFTYLRIGSLSDGSWDRGGDFTRINTLWTANAEIFRAAFFIATKIGAWPTLFAYPFGHASEYLRYEYFPHHAWHTTYAAFCVRGEAATPRSDRYCIPRITHTGDWWTPEEFVTKVLRETL